MGSVKGTRIAANNKVEYTVSIDYEESLLLKGHATNVHIFSEDSVDIATNLVKRGRGNTVYIRMPRKIANGVREKGVVKCMRMESKDKIIIYTVIEK